MTSIEAILEGIPPDLYEQDFSQGRVTFRAASHAMFTLGIYYDTSPTIQIFAEAIPPSDSDMFWYYPLEDEFQQLGEEQLAKECRSILLRLLRLPLRIVQTRGWFLWEFQLDAWENGSWARVYGHSALRCSFSAPPITGKSKEYLAPVIWKAA